MEVSEETILNIVGWIGTILGVFLTLSPISIFIMIYKGQSKIEILPPMMIYSSVLCNILCTCYNLRVDVFLGYFSSIICLIIAIIFLVIFNYFTYINNKVKFLIYSILHLFITYFLYYLFMYIIPDTQTVGKISASVLIINAASPGQNIFQVIKTQNYKLIPIKPVIFGFLCSICWLIFGFIRKDKNGIASNGVSTLMNCLNIFVWLFYYLKNKNKIKKN